MDEPNAAANRLIQTLIARRAKAGREELAQIRRCVAAAPFTAALLEADEPLWGSFWHGDVIAPGYRLPAVELALLRAVRLDGNWPEETSAAEFLAGLRAAVEHPRAGVWTLPVAGEPCAVFAAGSGPVTVVWYCASTGCLHAGYRTAANRLFFAQAVEQRPFRAAAGAVAPARQTGWIARTASHAPAGRPRLLAARLDAGILRIRAGLPP